MPVIDPSLVAEFPLFAGLSRVQIEDVLKEAKSSRFARNALVFEQGAEATDFFLLLHGRVRASRLTPTGEQVVVRFVGPGELFGVAAAIGKAVYPANAQAVVDSVVLSWRTPLWMEFVQRYPSLAMGAMQTIGQRLEETQTRFAELSTQDVERRIAHTLLRLASQGGRKTEDGVVIDFPISRQDVAEMTGTTLHTVSRILSAWEDQGYVAGGRQKITIRDPHKLYGLAQGGPR